MKTFHLSFDEPEDSYRVFAIFSDEHDYRLTYLLNYHLSLHLVKGHSLIDKKKDTTFSIFEYEDTHFFRNWVLLNNYCLINNEIKQVVGGLFEQEQPLLFQKKEYYFKKYKKASFLLKIEAGTDIAFYKKIQDSIQIIPQIYTVEQIDLTSKNKKLLNF